MGKDNSSTISWTMAKQQSTAFTKDKDTGEGGAEVCRVITCGAGEGRNGIHEERLHLYSVKKHKSRSFRGERKGGYGVVVLVECIEGAAHGARE